MARRTKQELEDLFREVEDPAARDAERGENPAARIGWRGVPIERRWEILTQAMRLLAKQFGACRAA